MDPGKLFRKAALEKMASPERLDEMMEVTAPLGWLALIALGVMLAGAVVWGVYGTIAQKVQGNGILLRGEAVLAVTAGEAGRVDEILVGVGEVIEEGQLVARVSQDDLALRIENTREEMRTLISQSQGQAVSTARIIAQLETQKRELQEKIAQQEALVARGLVTRGTLLGTKAQLASVDQQIAENQVGTSARSNRIADTQRRLRELEQRMEEASAVRSPYAGRVLEVATDSGNLVGPGTRLLSLEALEGSIDAVIYIPAGDGKKVREGMEVRVSPSTVKAEEYGFIIGRVRKVSSYPVTLEAMARVLRNEQVVKTLAGGGAAIEVVAHLIEDPTTESGFRWSSSGGPPSKVFTGTICTANVVVEEKRPISYVLPIFREALGVS